MNEEDENMGDRLFKKGLAIGIILLFIGISFQPAFANYNTIGNEKQQQENEFSIRTNPVNPSGGTFMKTFGGTSCDEGSCVRQTSDGGYIITGLTESFGAGSYDIWLIKTDSDGNEIWNKTFGGTDRDWSSCVQQTTDGGYIITGYTELYSGPEIGDVWLIKTDSAGNMVWNRTFGGTDDDVGYCVQQTTDGGYIITGYTVTVGYGKSNVWLIKTDIAGNMIWNRTFGGTDYDVGSCVQQTTDGGYIITGYTGSLYTGESDVWLIKTNSKGNMVWVRTFGRLRDDIGLSIQQTNDGGYIITGATGTVGYGKSNVLLIKTDSDGNKVWDRTFGRLRDDIGLSIQQTNDGGYIITGVTDSIGDSGVDAWLIKTNSNGNIVWDRIFRGTDVDVGSCVQQTTDGGYIITGYTGPLYTGETDAWLIKTDKDGRIRNKSISSSSLLRFLERFPMLQSLLQRLGLQ